MFSFKWLKLFAISVLAIFAPIQAVLTTTAALVSFDLVSGIWAAFKRNERITSSGIRRSLTKLCVYEMALMLAFIAEKYMLSDLTPIVKLVSSMIALAELKSIYENLSSVLGDDLLRSIMARISSNNETK